MKRKLLIVDIISDIHDFVNSSSYINYVRRMKVALHEFDRNKFGFPLKNKHGPTAKQNTYFKIIFMLQKNAEISIVIGYLDLMIKS
jgi:hypothetical protein